MLTGGAPKYEAPFVLEMTDARTLTAVLGAGPANARQDPVLASGDHLRKNLGCLGRRSQSNRCRHAVSSFVSNIMF